MLNRCQKFGGCGNQHACGSLVVFGLADQVIGNQPGVGRIIGHNQNLCSASFAVDANLPAECSLGGGHENVSGSGDHHYRLEPDARHAIGEGGDGGGSADYKNVLNAKQSRCCQHRGVRAAREGGLTRCRDCESGNASDLSRHHVHNYAAGIHGLSTWNIQADRVDGLPTLVNGCPVGELHRKRLSQTSRRNGTHSLNAGFDGRTKLRVEFGECRFEFARRHFERPRVETVKLLSDVDQCILTAVFYVFEQWSDLGYCGIDVQSGARHPRVHQSTRKRQPAQVFDSHACLSRTNHNSTTRGLT